LLAPRAELLVAADADDGTAVAAARDLARAAAPGLRVAVADRHAADSAIPRATIVTFDDIRPAAASHAPAGSNSARDSIVTPRLTQEKHIVVRRDSPLSWVHQIPDARVNFGPVGSAERRTSVRLFQRMFGVTVPQDAGTRATGDALRALAHGEVDVVIVVDGQPSPRLAGLGPEASALRLLPVDLSDGTTQRAAEEYLPTRLRAASYVGWMERDVPTLATMAFLVAPDTGPPGAAQVLAGMAATLCRELGALRREGHPKWREVQLGLALDGAWEVWPPAQAAFGKCAGDAGSRVAAAPPGGPPRGVRP
jgi:hypothetical protein